MSWNRREGGRSGVPVPLGIVAFWISAMLVGSHLEFAVEAFRGRIIAVHPRYAEWAIYQIILLTVGRAVVSAHVFKKARQRDRVLLASLTWLMLAGQVAGHSIITYPFVTWSMYSSPAPDASTLRFRAEFDSGPPIDFPFFHVIPTTSELGVRGRLTKTLLGQIEVSDSIGEGVPPAGTDPAWLRALAREYARYAPGEPITSITVIRRTVPLGDFQGIQSIEDKVLTTIPVREPAGE